MGFVCTEEGGAKTAFFFIREGLWGRDWLCYRLGPRSVKVVFCMGGGARAAMWIVIGSCLGGWADRLQEGSLIGGTTSWVLDQDVSSPCLFEKVDSGSSGLCSKYT